MKLLAFLLRDSRGTVALSILAGVGSGLCGVGLIALVHAELAGAHPRARPLAWGFAGLCALAALTRVVAQATLVRLSQGSVARLCAHLGRRILALPLRQFEEIDPGKLLAVLTDDTLILSHALTGIPLLCINGPIVIACLVYVGWLSPAMLLCGLLVAVPGVLGYEVIGARGLRELKRARAGQDALVGHFRSLIEGFRELKIHRRRRERFLADCLDAAAATVRDRNAAGLTLFAAAGSWSQVAFFGFLGLLLLVLPGWQGIRREALSGAVVVTLYIMTPLEIILTWLPVLGRARVSLLKIEEVGLSLAARGAEEPAPANARRLEWRGSVRLREATYSYRHGGDEEGFTLGPIDLALRPGELVFLAGGNGSGKTTLVKLLAGLYSPESGAVLLDGEPVAPERREEYRQLFSVLFADGHLFDSLIGLDGPDLDARARAGLGRLELGRKVTVRGGSFSTTDLSQGQRKRLALLTLLLEDRPVCVFDEWAAHQDPHFKNIFYHEILPELRARGKALLVITHDEEFHHVADRVLRLESGRMTGHQDHAPLRSNRRAHLVPPQGPGARANGQGAPGTAPTEALP